ncbi:hypothetical protein ACFVSN_16955 [Kitasatospora sp. NPDC057904]|uniref:hypothetical protein n=1 Tax=Kitasatospora sp. NPDC057904 TaxID=3346275 RepID=UPI0036D993F6
MAAPHNQNDPDVRQLTDDTWQFGQEDPPGRSAGQQYGRPATAPPGYFAPAKPKRRPFRTAYFAVLGVLFCCMLGLTGFLVLNRPHLAPDAQVDGNGNVTKGGDLGLRSLTTGQCFDEPSGAAQQQVDGVSAVPCGDPHDAQVIGYSMLTDSSYDEAKIKDEAAAACQKLSAGPNVDRTKLGSGANIVDFVPTAGSWQHFDRKVTCAVDNGTGAKLTGSVLK